MHTLRDNTSIQVSISTRWQTLDLPWSKVRCDYLMRFYGQVGLDDATEALTAHGAWRGDCDGGTLFLKVNEPRNSFTE
jgi:hypothetical protein